jgi:flagellar hook assembly protein FlgD
LALTVKETASEKTVSFALEQNYPNPFNPSTTIQFTLSRFDYVTLKVYSTLGEKVATLVAQNLSAGRHQVTWNANNITAGVYFYRLQTDDLVQTRKLVLLK